MAFTVLRMFLVSFGVGLVAGVITLLALPNSTEIEKALPIVEIAFVVSAVIAIVVQILLRRRK